MDELVPARPGLDLLPQLEHNDADAQGAAAGVEHGDVQIVPLLGLHPHQVAGARQAAGEHDGDHLLIAVGADLIQGVAEHAPLGQGGAGQLPPVEAVVHVLGKDVHPVGELPVVTADFQRHHVDGLALPHGRGQVGGGIGEQRDLFRI